MRELQRTLWVALVLALCSGCGSITSFQRARTLPRGDVELGGDLGLSLPRTVRIPRGFISDETQYPTYAPFFGIPWGFLDLSGAYGLTDRVEGRARLSAVGLEIGAKIRLLDLDPVPLVISTAPSVRARLGAPRPAADAALPLLIGVPFGEDRAHELVFSPRYMPSFGGYNGITHGFGGGLGVAFATSERATLMLETGLLVTRTGSSIPGATMALLSLGVGYSWRL